MNLTQFTNSALTDRVALYIPTTVNVNRPTDNSATVAKVAREFSEMFGGATQADRIGYYLANNGELVKEAVTVIYSNTNRETLEANFSTVLKMAEDIRDEYRQEAVTVEVNGAINFI